MLVSKTADICGVLSHTTRYYILRALVSAGESGLSQRQLKLKLALSRAALKRHVDQLVKVGIVTAERQERAVLYRADPVKLADFTESLTRHFEPQWVLRMDDRQPSETDLPSLRERLNEVLPEQAGELNQSAHNIEANS